jgi:hypothetical protein
MNSLGPTRQSTMTERTSAHKAGRDLAMLGLAHWRKRPIERLGVGLLWQSADAY